MNTESSGSETYARVHNDQNLVVCNNAGVSQFGCHAAQPPCPLDLTCGGGSCDSSCYRFDPSATPTAVPTTAEPTAVPSAAPSNEIVTIESTHKYPPNANEVWAMDIPNTTCFSVTMDPQSWTPESADFVRIMRVNRGGGDQTHQTTPGHKRLYKRRLLRFGTAENTEYLRIVFRSNAAKQAWGFKVDIQACPVANG